MELIGVVGVEGTYGDKAADAFGSALQLKLSKVYVGSIPQAFSEVESGRVDYAVVPMENFLEGAVAITSDLLYYSESARICAEVYVPVKHCLAALSKAQVISAIVAHPQAAVQCRAFIAKNYPKAALLKAESGLDAMELISSRNMDKAAAIGDPDAAKRLGLVILSQDVGDAKANETRYIVISSRPSFAPTGKDKTTCVLYDHKDEPGLLRKMLEPFEDGGINLSRIESRPSLKRLGEYVFHVDFEAHEQEAKAKAALARLSKLCSVKMLGSYSRASARN